MFARVVRDLHDIQLEAHVAFPNAVDSCDVRTLLIHRLHELCEQQGGAFVCYQ